MFRPITVTLLTFCAHPLFGGVVFDGSLGNHIAGLAPFTNSNGMINYMIPANYGTQKGGNLFQSFSQFNLTNTQSATFMPPVPAKGLPPPPRVHNILARVTSGSRTSIDGTINSDIPGANLFFMNPAGVVFGKDAQLNVSDSFAVSTANYLKLADGGKFNTSLGGGDMLTCAPVSAFGFLEAPARVSFAGPRSARSPFLNIASGKSFSVVAGNITMNDYGISGAGARVNLVSVKSAGEAKLDATAKANAVVDVNSAVDVTQFTAMGTIDITNSTRINTNLPLGSPQRAELGGPVFIRAGALLLDNSQINSNSYSGNPQRNTVSNIDVQAHDVRILAGSRISAPTVGSAAAGHVTVMADSLSIDGEGVPSSTGLFALATQQGNITSSGNGGDVTVIAGNIEITNGGAIGAFSEGYGNGGTVNVTARGSLLIKGEGVIGMTSAGIFSDARTGNGGDITVTAGDVEIVGDGDISTGTFSTFPNRSGGSITVTATHSLLIDGTGSEEGLFLNPDNPVSGNTRVFNGTGILALGYGSGNGGNITLNAPRLSIIGGGQVAAATFGTGNGGTINVKANSLRFDGRGALENVLFSTGVFADARGHSGMGGEITVTASDATLTADGQIAASTFGSGMGGRVEVTAKNSLLVHGSDSGIFAVAAAGPASTGDGGDVVVSAGDLSLQNRGSISAASFTSGDAGSVHLSRVGTLSIDSGSSISSANTGSGDGGSVTINTTGPVTVKDGSGISTESTVGNAGDIKLTSGGEIKLKGQSSITASAGVNGGNITITAPEQLVYLVDSSITATAGSTGSSGTGGNITIDHPEFIVASNSLISANATVGTAGNVLLNSDFLFSSNSTIFATGTINITAPSLDLGAQLITLPTSLLSAASQLQERCTTLLQADFSSFISIGRGGTEPAPEELQEEF